VFFTDARFCSCDQAFIVCPNPPPASGSQSRPPRSPSCPLAHDYKGRPIFWIRLLRFARLDKSQHRLTHSICTADRSVGCHSAHSTYNQLHRGVRVNCPMGDQERAGSCIKERPRARRDSASAPSRPPAAVLCSLERSNTSELCAQQFAANRSTCAHLKERAPNGVQGSSSPSEELPGCRIDES